MGVTAKDVLDLARKEIGYKETPANSNMTKYGAAIGLNGQPWCMSFIMWIFDKLGARSMLPIRTGSCSAFLNAAKNANPKQVYTSNFQAGDVVIYTFGHCGIIESTTSGKITAIEGNTAVGNDANGGMVMRRTRSTSLVKAVYRPSYTAGKSTFIVAQEVLEGKWGNGDTRRDRLMAAGYDPAEVQKIVNALSKGGVPVRVTASTGLSVRSGPGTNYSRLDLFGPNVRVSIEEVREGTGATAWGRVGNGWISLDYVQVV